LPDTIDLGEIPIYEVDTTGLKGDKNIEIYYNILNNSQKEYYVFSHNHQVIKDLPYIGNFIRPDKIRKYDSINYIISIIFPYSKIIDFYNNTYYLKSWLIYRDVDSLQLDSSEITFKFKVIKENGYRFLSDENRIFYYADFNRPHEINFINIGKITNYLEEFNIDSLKYSSDFNTINDIKIQKSGVLRSLPLSHKNMEQIRLIASITISDFRDTKLNIEIYGRHVKSQNDTIYKFNYVFKPRLFENYIAFNTWNTTYVPLSRFRDSKDFELEIPKMANYTPHQYTIKDIEFIADHPEYIIRDYKNPPIELPKIQDSKIIYTNVDLGRIFISTPNQEEFENNVLIIFHLEDGNGYKQTESLYLKYFIDPLLSIGDEQKNSGIVLFPNPATDYITINLSSINPTLKRGVEGGVVVEIYDLMGIKIHSTPVETKNFSSLQRIDISNLSPGVYFLKIVGCNGACSIVEKFVKM
jgi:hypothetical protein